MLYYLFCSIILVIYVFFFFFFFNDTATTEIYTLSLHDALPISLRQPAFQIVQTTHTGHVVGSIDELQHAGVTQQFFLDRKSTRLNSSHGYISYAVFCLQKKTRP